MKVAYIECQVKTICGGSVINQRNLRAIEAVCGKENVSSVRFEEDNLNITLLQRFKGFSGGVTPKIIEKICQIIGQINPELVVVSNSIYGKISQNIKKKYPNVQIATFFHNVEYDYIKAQKLDLVRNILSPKLVKIAEKLSVKNSDSIWAMNQRDSLRLKQLYGKAADLLLPTTFEDTVGKISSKNVVSNPIELLFVGFNFFANLEGVRWLCQEVMPQLIGVAHLNIVGRNMELNRHELERNNVTVVGSVDEMTTWYDKADIVVLPIFSGSGMKTKTAEAMMYGKPIIATKESFEGYEIENYNSIGGCCKNAQEFIENIKVLANNPQFIRQKGEVAREIFLEKYTIEATIKQIKKKLTTFVKIKTQ